MAGTESAVPGPVAQWLDARHAPWRVLADASWDRDNSRVWRVEVHDVDAFVKISPSDPAFRREQSALAEMLAWADVSTQTLLDAEPSLRVLLTAAVAGEVARDLVQPVQPETEQQIHAAAGAAIRRVHDLVGHVSGDVRSAAAARTSRMLEKTSEHLAACSDLLEADDLRMVVIAQGAVRGAQGCELGYIHGDFQPRNWLWHDATRTTSLIDFEEASVGYAVEDFGWLFATTWPCRHDLRDAFLGGYGRTLNPSETCFLAAGTVLGSLERVADGVRLGIPKKIQDGLGALRVSSAMLGKLIGPSNSGAPQLPEEAKR